MTSGFEVNQKDITDKYNNFLNERMKINKYKGWRIKKRFRCTQNLLSSTFDLGDHWNSSFLFCQPDA